MRAAKACGIDHGEDEEADRAERHERARQAVEPVDEAVEDAVPAWRNSSIAASSAMA
jgi:hypothetical protein